MLKTRRPLSLFSAVMITFTLADVDIRGKGSQWILVDKEQLDIELTMGNTTDYLSFPSPEFVIQLGNFSLYTGCQRNDSQSSPIICDFSGDDVLNALPMTDPKKLEITPINITVTGKDSAMVNISPDNRTIFEPRGKKFSVVVGLSADIAGMPGKLPSNFSLHIKAATLISHSTERSPRPTDMDDIEESMRKDTKLGTTFIVLISFGCVGLLLISIIAGFLRFRCLKKEGERIFDETSSVDAATQLILPMNFEVRPQQLVRKSKDLKPQAGIMKKNIESDVMSDNPEKDNV